MIKILFSDDNERMFEECKDVAYKMGAELICVTNWEDAQTELTDNWDSYSGLILDGKGKLDEAASGNNVVHLHRGLNWLNQQYGKGLYMPTIVYSAYIGAEKGNLEEQIDVQQPFVLDVFSKHDIQIDYVLKKIITHNNGLPEKRIKFLYSDIFKLFDDKRVYKNMGSTMFEVLNSLSSATPDKSDYNKVRDIIEAMLKMANSIDKVFIPDALLNPAQNNRPNLRYSELYLTGREVRIGATTIPRVNPIMVDHIGWIYSSIVNCCQIFSHNATQKHSQYAYQSTVFGLLEVLLWYKDYLTNKYGI